MRNAEKYKTAKERVEKFREFCDAHDMLCEHNEEPCLLEEHADGDPYGGECFAYWLDLEAPEEEKPLPCPFCGNTEIEMCIVEDMSDGYMATPNIHCKHCGASFDLEWERTTELGYELTKEQKYELLKKWNRRAVMAAAREVAK